MKKYKWEQEQISNMKDYIARFGHGSAKLARQAQVGGEMDSAGELRGTLCGGVELRTSSKRVLDWDVSLAKPLGRVPQPHYVACGKLGPHQLSPASCIPPSSTSPATSLPLLLSVTSEARSSFHILCLLPFPLTANAFSSSTRFFFPSSSEDGPIRGNSVSHILPCFLSSLACRARRRFWPRWCARG